MKSSDPVPHAAPDCPTLRLAQGDIATIDMCSCGTLRLNVGAVTLRLTPEALGSIMQTLGEGLATHAALRARPRFAAPATLAAGVKAAPPQGRSS